MHNLNNVKIEHDVDSSEKNYNYCRLIDNPTAKSLLDAAFESVESGLVDKHQCQVESFYIHPTKYKQFEHSNYENQRMSQSQNIYNYGHSANEIYYGSCKEFDRTTSMSDEVFADKNRPNFMHNKHRHPNLFKRETEFSAPFPNYRQRLSSLKPKHRSSSYDTILEDSDQSFDFNQSDYFNNSRTQKQLPLGDENIYISNEPNDYLNYQLPNRKYESQEIYSHHKQPVYINAPQNCNVFSHNSEGNSTNYGYCSTESIHSINTEGSDALEKNKMIQSCTNLNYKKNSRNYDYGSNENEMFLCSITPNELRSRCGKDDISSVNVYKYNKSMEELDLKKYYKIFPEKRNLKTNQENYTSSTSVNPRNDKHIYDKKPFNISTQNQDKIYNHQRRYTGEEYQCYNKNMNQSTNNGVNCSRDCTHTKYYNESCSSSLNLNINNINMNQSFNSLNRNKVDTIHNEINSPFPLAAETIASNAVNFRNTSLVLNCPVKLTSRYNSNMGNNTSVFSNYRMCSPRNDILLNSMDSDDWKMENETYKSSYLNPKPIRQYSSFNHDMTTSTPMSKGIVRKDSNQSINLLEEEAIMQD